MRLALVFSLLALGPLLALSPPPPYFESAAQDASGVIWAFSRAEYNKIYRYDGKKWSEHKVVFPSNENAMPARVVRMTDGNVACIWRVMGKKSPLVGVSIQSGKEARVLGTCEGEISQSGLTSTPFADSQNRLWITGSNDEIYRADKNAVVKVHIMPPEEYVEKRNSREGFNPVRAVEDGHGRIWIWSDFLASNWAQLRGVLIFDGDKPQLHETISTVKADRILAIAKADDQHMWISFADDGLYKVDIDTLALEREAEPEPKAFCCIRELFVHGGELFAVASKGSFSETTLWRKKDEDWKKLIPHFDKNGFSYSARSWLPLKEGLLVESYQEAPWFVPVQGVPAKFSWRTGFPFESVSSLARFDDGSFFCLTRESAIFHGNLTLPPVETREAPRVIELDTERDWAVDPDSHVWILSKDNPQSIRKWDGTQWIDYPIPELIDSSFEWLKVDTQGRLWPIPQSGESAISIFDSHTGKWQTFPTLQDAFLALKKTPPKFLNDEEWFLTPHYSSDQKRIAYREGVTNLHYFDGSKWRNWDREKITGKKGDDAAIGVPWFDQKGKLRVNIRQNTSWKMNDAGKWSEIPFESHFPKDIWSEDPQEIEQPVPPDGAVTKEPDSIAVDNLGITWIEWQNRIYRCLPGVCVPVFGADEMTPIPVKSLIQEIFVDKTGNAFIKTASTDSKWFMIKPKEFLPTTITVNPTGPDSVQVTFDAHSSSPVQFRWQLDNGPVQIAKEPALTVASLPNGEHQITILSRDDQLPMNNARTAANFKTFVDPEAQLRGLIARLSDPDFENRKTAVHALALQPETARAALQKARLEADDSLRWWIDAALEEIKSRTAPFPENPSE